MASVKLKSVIKRFGDITAINKLDLEIKDGEFFVLLGPTGAGKTTTLRVVAGLETPEEGEVLINDVVVNDLSPANRDAAFIFQYYSLYPHYTVRQNLEFPLKAKIRRTSKEDMDKRVIEVAQILHIDHLLDRRSDKLSGGEMQRVTIGRAIVRTPKVFLMDEPLSNLDAKLREEMRAELKRLQVDMGSTIFFVTHDQVEAMTMGDRIAVLNKGEILQIGTPAEIYDIPDNIFVATFVGSPAINILETEVDSSFVVEPSILEYKPAEPQKKILTSYRDKRVNLGIRPEDITVSKSKAGPEDYACEVYIVEKMGMEDILRLKIGKNILRAITPPTFHAQIGDIVYASFDKDRTHFFDMDTGKRIV